VLLDLGSGDEKVQKAECKKFLTPGYTTAGHVELYTVRPLHTSSSDNVSTAAWHVTGIALL